MTYGIYAIIGLTLFLSGYSIGRRMGIKEGFEQGRNINTLHLKEQLLEKAFCPLCHKLH